MFKSVIRNTPMTSSEANDYFQNITGESFGDDWSFLATLRALAAPRMKDNDQICLLFTNDNLPIGYTGNDPCKFFSMVNADNLPTGTIQVYNFCHPSENDNDICIEAVRSSFEKQFDGWYRLQKVTDFYRKSFYTICFINPEKKSVIIFVTCMNIRTMHYLQCSIFAFLPWYFNPSDRLSEIEMELVNSLREKTSVKYEQCIAEISSRYDFRTAKIHTLLSGFETRYERAERERVRLSIQSYIDRIDTLNKQIGQYLQDKALKETLLMGLETKIAQSEGNSEIMEYFLCNRKLVLESVTDTEMVFGCVDYLEYFDEDMAKKVIENKNSYVYIYASNGIPAEDIKMLMTAIFLDQTLRIKLCAAYRFRLHGGVDALPHHTYGYEFRDCMPNPHIDEYHCMGSYQTTINQLLRDNNYIGALEQCIASCKSLNFGDCVVMDEFMKRICEIRGGVNTRCIELPDGTVVKPKKAIEWLKTQKGEELPNE